jgi:tRNA dimethylallyltransferase
VAERLNGELVSVDSRQVYRHCNIGTNKPTAEELRGIRCQLIDVVDPGTAFTVADYQQRALAAVDEIAAGGKLPVLQGGTGLYLRALLDGWNFGQAPPNKDVRARLEQRLEQEGPEGLDAALRAVDPAAADLAQRNPRRLIRALEIHQVTGRTPSEVRAGTPPPWSVHLVGLEVPLGELDARIERRVTTMLAAGWIEEVRSVGERYPAVDWQRLGHGYPEIAAYVAGRLSLDEAQRSTVRQVRQYARRQYTWFRADRRVHWMAPDRDALVERLSVGIMGPGAS